jgi:hypothetical protein
LIGCFFVPVRVVAGIGTMHFIPLCTAAAANWAHANFHAIHFPWFSSSYERALDKF